MIKVQFSKPTADHSKLEMQLVAAVFAIVAFILWILAQLLGWTLALVVFIFTVCLPYGVVRTICKRMGYK